MPGPNGEALLGALARAGHGHHSADLGEFHRDFTSHWPQQDQWRPQTCGRLPATPL